MKSLFLDHRSAKNCIHMNEWVLDSMHRIQFSLNTLNHLRFPMLSNNKHLFQTFRMIIKIRNKTRMTNLKNNSKQRIDWITEMCHFIYMYRVIVFFQNGMCICLMQKYYPLVDEYHKISLSPIHSTCSKYHYFEYLFLFCFQNNIKINTKTKHFYIRQSSKPK